MEASLAGPKRPQDRVRLSDMKEAFSRSLTAPRSERGYELPPGQLAKKVSIEINGQTCELRNGSVVIAAITSCTNTSNPYVMIAAGILAKNAVNLGLSVNPLVKTSLAPGSRVVVEYLAKAGLLKPLGKLGFNLVGFGCTTCIGNSGPIRKEIAAAIQAEKIVAAAVLSGNRNFEGRVHPQAQANYLASPPLVVAFALAGRVDINLEQEPIGFSPAGKPIFLSELWPTSKEIEDCIRDFVTPDLFSKNYSTIFEGNATWNGIEGQHALLYSWQRESDLYSGTAFFPGFDLVEAPS